jgi:hypothetical protein
MRKTNKFTKEQKFEKHLAEIEDPSKRYKEENYDLPENPVRLGCRSELVRPGW